MGYFLNEDSGLRFDYGNMRDDVGLIGEGANVLSGGSLDLNIERIKMILPFHIIP